MTSPAPIDPVQQAKVDVLLQALPYIQEFRDQIAVVKLGGNAMGDPDLFSQFAQDLMLMRSVGLRPVVVHGGGPQIGDWLAKLGIETNFVDGQRVTDLDTLEVAQMVLVGKVNSDIVSALNAHRPIAVGLSGQAAGLIRAEPRDPGLGFVGDVTGVDPSIIERLVAEDLIPVVSTIGSDALGQAYNINADAVASAIAGALGAQKLIYLTDVAGLLADLDDPGSLIVQISPQRCERFIEDGTIAGGMIPKIAGCLAAIDAGVEGVHLIDGRLPHVLLLELFTDAGVGTMISRGDP